MPVDDDGGRPTVGSHQDGLDIALASAAASMPAPLHLGTQLATGLVDGLRDDESR
jgi:hypothetical protein